LSTGRNASIAWPLGIAAEAEGTSKVGRRGGKGGSYDDWSKAELEKKASDVGINGRSSIKDELVKALRKH
jgi:hypothetical protein